MAVEEAANSDDIFDAALAHHQAGRLSEAEQQYQRALQVDPGHPGALYFLGALAYESGRYELAVELVNSLVCDEPNDIEALHLLGLISAKLDKYSEAVEFINKALALNPSYIQAHYSLGELLQSKDQLDEAASSFRRVLALDPQHAEAHCSLANILKVQNKLDEAAASYKWALALKPDLDLAHNNLGQILHVQGEFDEALACYRRELALNPNADTYNNLGAALYAQGNVDEAIASYQQALLSQSDFALAHNNLGVALCAQGKLSEAIASYRRAIARQFDYPAAHRNLGSGLKELGKLEEAIASLQQAFTLKPDYVEAYTDYLVTAQYLADRTPQKIFAEHVLFAERFEAPLISHWPSHTNIRTSQRRLKVGFVSGDLHVHPVGFFLEGVLRNIDRQGFDITLYSSDLMRDALTERLQAMNFAWKPLTGLSDDAAASCITADAIDILVDLSGHTGANRLLVFARKPAPVQVAWLGYWATTGLQAIDYILCDPLSIPAAEADFFVEKPWYLPDTRLCFTAPTDNITVGPLPALSAGQITFGCFNNLAKMTDEVVAVWARILHDVAYSRLFLKSKPLGDTMMKQAVLERFAAHGIAADRLLLEADSSRAQYFAAYQRVDIALDPFPFTGGTTSIEGLWMGVPMITRRGDRLIARQGESILHNLRMSDWVAADEDAYVAMALARANDLTSLASLRAQLRAKLLQSPLCDAPQFARNLESAFRGMWESYCSKT